MPYFTDKTSFNTCPEFELLIPVLKKLETQKEALFRAAKSEYANDLDKEKSGLMESFWEELIKPIKEFNKLSVNPPNNQALAAVIDQLKNNVHSFLYTHYAHLNRPRNDNKKFGQGVFSYFEVFLTGINVGAGCSLPTLVASYTVTHCVTKLVSSYVGLSDSRSTTVQLLSELDSGLTWVFKFLTQPDYYAVLGLSAEANPTDVQIKEAYHTRSKATHPDKHPEKAAAEMAEINAANEVLTDPEKRKEHDEFLTLKKLHFKTTPPPELRTQSTFQLTM